MGDDTHTTEAWTVARLLAWTSEYLAQAQVDEPRLSTELLLAHALGWAKIDLYARFDHVPAETQRTAFRELIRQAAEHQPIAYLIGRKEFYSLSFEVTPDVLIPRPETETLVERVIDHCRAGAAPEVNFLDLGTGSGCIAVAVLSQVPTARAVASDVSPAALAVARGNADRHGVSDRLACVEADALALPSECVPEGGFDLIASNPPYIADEDLPALPDSVRRFEPRIALTAGPDGLAFYRVLQGSAAEILKPGGSLFVEIGAGAAGEVRRILESENRFRHTGTWRDHIEGHERTLQFVRGEA